MKPIRLSKVLAFLLPTVVAVTACGDDGMTGQETGASTVEPTTEGDATTTTTTTGDPSDTSVTVTTAETVDSGSSESGPPPGGDACETYCTNAIANCTGDNTLYPGMEECMATCAGLPEGNPTDQAGNTAWCRAYHAGDPAVMDATMHCPHASASGGTVCGTPCEAYCSLATANCGGEIAVYPSEGDCMAACAAFPDDGEFNAIDGNSVQCRIYHASFPATLDAMTHCGHAGPNGGATCGSLCAAYCDQATTNCPDLYVNEDECLTTCEGFPTDGDYYATEGDNVQCRTYHASFPAAADPNTHCPHAAPDGGGVCV
jgi:hypothetical protein